MGKTKEERKTKDMGTSRNTEEEKRGEKKQFLSESDRVDAFKSSRNGGIVS